MNPKELIAEVEALRAEKKGLLERERLLHRAFDQLTAERDEARAELAKAGESIRAYERMIDGVAEKASALACKEVEAELRWLGPSGWAKLEEDGNYTPTHFLPLPVTR